MSDNPNMGRVDFRKPDFVRLIEQKGLNVLWEQASVCDCLTRDSGQPDFNCTICGGSGFRYLPAIPIRVVVSSFQSAVKLESLGMREPGTAYATPQADIIMGWRDRLVFADTKCKFSETLYFDTTSFISQRTHRDIISIPYLMQNDNLLEEGTDYAITTDRHHVRLLSTDIDFTKGISALYLTQPSYLVDDILHELRYSPVLFQKPAEVMEEFPRQYKIVREDFIYGVDTAGNNAKNSDDLTPTITIEDEVIQLSGKSVQQINTRLIVDPPGSESNDY